MRRAILLAFALAGCSKPSQPQNATEMLDLQQAPPAPVMAPSAPDATSGTPPVRGPQIAYTYTISYSVDGKAIAAVQAQHSALCNRLGLARCHILTSTTSNDDEGLSNSSIALTVDARLANDVQKQLDDIVIKAGGHVAGRNTASEDVTKQIVDTDARVRAKQALADRLLGLIKSGNGKVGELVEAERAFSETQEELDAARSLQAELRERVAMSNITINYSSGRTDNAWSPIGRSVRNGGQTLTMSIAAAITFVLAAIPWVVLASFLYWGVRKAGLGRRLRSVFRRRPFEEPRDRP